jgi:hypothetical protein
MCFGQKLKSDWIADWKSDYWFPDSGAGDLSIAASFFHIKMRPKYNKKML